MNKPVIHFAHANGFPARTYNKLFSFLPGFDIRFIERLGHNPEYPVTNGWRNLKEELEVEIEKRFDDPVIGIGHSLGGILHLLTAIDKPELYKAIILLDAPIISPLSSLGIKILKKTNLSGKISPARETNKRRKSWKDTEEAFVHFVKKEKFRAFDEDVLRDYIKYGTVSSKEGIKLFFEPAIESEIYQTIPDYLPKLKGRINVPVSYIGGTNSREARLAGIKFMQKNFRIKFHFLKGTHLFPLEVPQLTAELIRQSITGESPE